MMPALTVAENVFLGRQTLNRLGLDRLEADATRRERRSCASSGSTST